MRKHKATNQVTKIHVGFTGGEGEYVDKKLLPFSFSYVDCTSEVQAFASASHIAEQLKAEYPQMTWLHITIDFKPWGGG